MLSKPSSLLVLAVACVAAAGGGAYLASLQNTAVSIPVQTAAAQADAATLETPAVSESEALVSDTELLVETAVDAPSPVVEAPRQPAPARRARVASAPRTAPADPGPPAAARPAPAPGPATPPPGLERPWPSRDPEDADNAAYVPPASVASAPDDPEEPIVPAVPERVLEELVVPADSVLGLQMETTVSSESARIEDRVEARVTREVRVGNEVAIPAGTRALGSITVVERGGKVRERARLGIRFHTLVLGDGTTLPVRTETIYREGDSPARESAAKIGGATIGGAIIGGIFGGKKGAILGGSAGAAGGTAVVMSGDRSEASIQSGSTVTVRLSEPVTVTVEK
jgi:hypothetical protein